MDIDEPEVKDGGGDNSVHRLSRAMIEGDHAVNKGGQVLRPCADMVRQRQAGFMVVLANEPPALAEPKLYKTRFSENDLLQPQQLFAIKPLAAGFADRTAPALDAVL